MVVAQLKYVSVVYFKSVPILFLYFSVSFFCKLSEMATDGFKEYDSTISQQVHVMTSVLCFTADSPMHAEIKNTHVPGNSLNSC
jgi:hypothetical protein